MVGVNTLIQVGAGGAYGFAIPVNEVRRVAQVLIKDGRVRYPYLGLHADRRQGSGRRAAAKLGKQVPPTGAFVAELTPGGPAGKAGMRPGDVITEVDSQKVKAAPATWSTTSPASRSARRVMLHYVRDGKPAQTQVALGELPDEDRQAAEAQPGRRRGRSASGCRR